MGWGSFISKVVSKVKSVATNTVKTIGKAGKSVIKSASPVISKVYSDAKTAVSKVYSDAKSFAEKPFEMVQHNVETLSNLGSNLGSSFAWPLSLAIGAVGVAYIMIK